MVQSFWQSVRHHGFILIALLGCIAPWITPRHFSTEPTSMGPIQSVISVSDVNMEPTSWVEDPVLQCRMDFPRARVR